VEILAIISWLLQAVARAGFFASLAVSLWRAWRKGWGVVIARILQLKLIHTTLVVSATMLLGATLWEIYPDFSDMAGWQPTWLTAPVISGVIAAPGVILLLAFNKRAWHFGLGLLLCAFFLYPGGPYLVEECTITEPIVFHRENLPSGKLLVTAENDPEKIAAKAAERQSRKYYAGYDFDIAANTQRYTERETIHFPYHYSSSFGSYLRRSPVPDAIWQFERKITRNLVETKLPVSAPGAALGWLAAPIPLLGLLGFAGLIMVMGRRSAVDLLAYLALTAAAISTTILPFVTTPGVDWSGLVNFGPLGVITAPFPGFEALLISPTQSENWLIIFGLLLSAGVPWLMTGLFLRPTSSKRDDSGTMAPVE